MASVIAPDGRVFDVDSDTIIGRGLARPGELPLIDLSAYEGGPTVSRRHARLTRSNGGWLLQVESESRNPTLVGDRVVSGGGQAPLADQTFIRLGSVVVMFRDQPQASGASAGKPEPLTTAPAWAAENWADRLTQGPATAAAAAGGSLKRVNPFRGLMIDETVWQDAHAYHSRRAQLELLLGHGHGIVEGLEVIADPDQEGRVIVRPGLAVNVHGQLLVVPQARTLDVEHSDSATVYVRLRYQEELTNPQRAWSDLDEYTRVTEGTLVDASLTPPSREALELGRISPGVRLQDAANPRQPGPGEIDLRYRERVGVRPRPTLSIGQLALEEPGHSASIERHDLGLRFLLREISLTTPFRARWVGASEVGDPLPEMSMLYVTGSGHSPLTAEASSELKTFLESGGTVLVDGCQDVSPGSFADWAFALAEATGRHLTPIQRGHPLLTARHVFSHSPLTGFHSMALAEHDGLVFSSVDLGCLWTGGADDRPAPRDMVRTALECGVNAAIYAHQRRFPLDGLEVDS